MFQRRSKSGGKSAAPDFQAPEEKEIGVMNGHYSTKDYGIRLRAAAMAATVMLLVATAEVRANITLDVDASTGDLQLVGAPGDTLASYVIYSASNAQSLNYTGWNSDRFGATSVANGFGTWMSMGTKSPATGQTTTYQLGEMCAVWAGYNTGGNPNPQTSVLYTFDATHTVINLGNHFLVGNAEDLVFGYGTTPGFYNGSDVPPAGTDGWIFDGLSHTYTVNVAGSYYNGEQFTSSGVTGQVVYADQPVPEPLTLLAVGMGIAGLVGYIRRRRLAAK
jgi:hypothetical protein